LLIDHLIEIRLDAIGLGPDEKKQQASIAKEGVLQVTTTNDLGTFRMAPSIPTVCTPTHAAGEMR